MLEELDKAVNPVMLNVREVAGRLGLSVRTIWRLAKDPSFPRPINVAKKATRWRADEVDVYLGQRQASA